MATNRKFEEMLEKLVNEDKAGAEELFHEIVVEKSRDIYESILEAELEDSDLDESGPDDGTRGGQKSASGEDEGEVGDATGGKRTGEKGKKMPVGKPTPKKDAEKVKESADDEEVEEDFDLDEFDVVEADPTDDMIDAVSADEMGGDMPNDAMDMDMDMDMDMEDGEGEIEDRVEDLEDALDELKAEFEAMMSDAGNDDEGDMDMDDMDGDDEGDMDDMGDDDEGEEMESYAFEADKAKDDKQKHPGDKKVADADADKGPKSQTEQMREYVEKVNAAMGDNGANAKSVVAGANDMGGTASNLVAGGEADTKGTGASAPKEDSAGNVNVPGGKAAKSLKSMPKGHGAEKKGAGETADNKKSIIGK